jgi:hypothetical protein
MVDAKRGLVFSIFLLFCFQSIFGFYEEDSVLDPIIATDKFGLSPGEHAIPFYRADENHWTGIAISNLSNVQAIVTMTAYGLIGQILELPNNPATVSIPAGGQLARLARELFEAPSDHEVTGWIHVVSDTDLITVFFQYGDIGPTKMDGGLSVKTTTSSMFLTRIHHGVDTFSDRDTTTEIFLVNPNSREVNPEITLFYHEKDSLESIKSDLSEQAIPYFGFCSFLFQS